MKQPNHLEEAQLAEQLHKWYLQATVSLNPASYNPKAQKLYGDLSEGQKSIDRFIAKKVLELIQTAIAEEIGSWRLRIDSVNNAHLWGDYGFSAREAWSGVNKVLEEMKKRKTQLHLTKEGKT